MMPGPRDEGRKGRSRAPGIYRGPAGPGGPVTLTAAQALGSRYTFYRRGDESTRGSVVGSKSHRWRVTESGHKPARFRGYHSVMLQERSHELARSLCQSRGLCPQWSVLSLEQGWGSCGGEQHRVE